MKRFGIERATQAAATALLLMIAAAGIATGAPERVNFYGLAFPEEVAGARRGSSFDFEKDTPGLGYSVRYERPGWLIDVYIYDLRMRSIPDDPTSEVMKKQLAQAKNDVFELERRGSYANVAVKNEYDIRDRSGRARFLCAAFNYLHKGMAATVDSYLCVTSWKNKFFKIRMTRPQNAASRADAQRFVEGWIAVLWPSSS